MCGATLAPLRSEEWDSHEGMKSGKSAAFREYFLSADFMAECSQNENRWRAC